MSSIITDVLGFIEEKRGAIKPEYVRNGKPVYTLRNYADMTDLDADVLLNGGQFNLAEKVPTFGRGGNLLRTPRTSYAVNVEIAFDNRVKIEKHTDDKGKESDVYVFVVDQRALMDQSSGHIYANFIVGYIIGPDAKGKPEVKGTKHIKEDEFVNDYDQTFDPSSMEEVMELINKYRLQHGTAKVIEELKFNK